ncbi:fibroblast growth factor receptor substrate 2-like [Liolophura sinensis]|uniref:fibroblast growth factor receptor substrate 2-like n=1 Tax=Liolophura sinensis TaxID=3198878 RepID=UPI003158FB78
MGCVYSRKDINDINPRMFRAYNVDDQGIELNPGKIEVSDTELILHQKGKEPIRWPWRCLRRYGFDAELFSFESGRRCPRGPGIYAFRCKRAEMLFNVVQECIQRAGQEDQAHLSQSVISATARTNSRPASVVETQDSNGFAHPPTSQRNPFGNGGLHLYVNGPAANDYINAGANGGPGTTAFPNGIAETSLIEFDDSPRPLSGASEKINYAVLDLPKSTENLSEEPGTRGAAVPVSPLKYADIDLENLNREKDSSLEDLPLCATDQEVFIDEETEGVNVQANYINVPADKSSMPSNFASVKLNPLQPPPAPPSPPTQPQTGRETSKINYIQLDLNQASESAVGGASATPTSPTGQTSVPDSPTKRNAERESYATIDFHKTTALHNSGKGTVEEEEGARKTRHSSTISELN